jgi:hypothetical protein
LVHKDEIIVDPQSASYLRKYGISVNINNKGNGQDVDNAKLDKIIQLLQQLIRLLQTQTQQDSQQREALQELIYELSETIPSPIVNELRRNPRQRL